MLVNVFNEINIDQKKYIGDEGLEIAVKELLDFKNRTGKIPKAPDFYELKNAIYRGEWLSYGIKKWNDLLNYVFGEVNLLIQNDYHATFGIVNRESNKYMGKVGLERAIQDLRDFKQKYGKKPNSSEADTIYGIVSEGRWKEFGITTWNDMLQSEFNEIFLDREKYKGKKGLEIAIQEMMQFKDEHNRKPKSNEMTRINNAITRGEWINFGIKTWPNLLLHVFGEIYMEFGKYDGKEGLVKAIQELKDFQKTNSRIPTMHDKGIQGINNAICRKNWKDFGINRWNDLMMTTFGVMNKEIGKYLGEEGLNRAIMEIKTYLKNTGKKPIANSQGFYGICGAIQRGQWRDFGIYLWSDLMKLAFKKVESNKKQLDLDIYMKNH